MKHSDTKKIRFVVARFFNVTEDVVTDSFVFTPQRLGGSVARSTLHAALKRLAGVDLPGAFTANTYGQLIHQDSDPAQSQIVDVSEKTASTLSASEALTAPPANAQHGVGIDIEFVENLPGACDPWTDAFFTENFTPREIAYCVRQRQPALSFCGLWCAKEALIKCGSREHQLRPGDVEMCHDESGRPHVKSVLANQDDPMLYNYHVSITHANTLAVAVCVRMPRTDMGPVPPTNDSAAGQLSAPESNPHDGATSSTGWLVWLSLLLSVAALALVLYQVSGK